MPTTNDNRTLKIESSLDQPAPEKGWGDMWERIIIRFDKTPRYRGRHKEKLLELFQERRKVGIERYGTPLQAFNGRNVVEDLLAEKFDALAYIEQTMIEKPELVSIMLTMFDETIAHIETLMNHV